MKTKCTIVKIGGRIVNDKAALFEFLKVFTKIASPKILIHGGGEVASELSNELGYKVKFINGRRVTTEGGLDVTTMVYSGLINTSICAKLNKLNSTAIGLSGVDGNIIQSIKRPKTPVDYGYVGDIQYVNGEVLNTFLRSGFCPVLCSITHDGKGQLLNTNADTIAAEVAVSMAQFYEIDLLYCFEKPGVLMNADDSNSIIDQIDLKKYNLLQTENIISEGMLPKLHNCFKALKDGVHNVRIGGVDCLENKAVGTEIKLEL